MAKLSRSFFSRDAQTVAQELIGKIISHRYRSKIYSARIVETEAYVGAHDLACHASKGRTARTEIMFGQAGFAYVYLVYGIHDLFNIVTGKVDDAQAVLIRAAEPVDGRAVNLTGPGNFSKGMKITRKQNKLDITGDILFLSVDENGQDRKTDIKVTRRIGEYLRAGVRLVWIIDPEERDVAVHRLGQPSEVFEGDQVLLGYDVLPELTCALADIFFVAGT